MSNNEENKKEDRGQIIINLIGSINAYILEDDIYKSVIKSAALKFTENELKILGILNAYKTISGDDIILCTFLNGEERNFILDSFLDAKDKLPNIEQDILEYYKKQNNNENLKFTEQDLKKCADYAISVASDVVANKLMCENNEYGVKKLPNGDVYITTDIGEFKSFKNFDKYQCDFLPKQEIKSEKNLIPNNKIDLVIDIAKYDEEYCNGKRFTNVVPLEIKDKFVDLYRNLKRMDKC